MSVARGYLQSVFPFWSPVSPPLTSLYLASCLSTLCLSSRLVTPSRSHRNEYRREGFLARGTDVLMRDFTFLARNANRRIHFCAFRRAAPFLPSIKTLASPPNVSRLVTRENLDLIFFFLSWHLVVTLREYFYNFSNTSI